MLSVAPWCAMEGLPLGPRSHGLELWICDEVDRYEASAGNEGDPASLAIERMTTFWNRKIAIVSRPRCVRLSAAKWRWRGSRSSGRCACST
ncbi:phage terminase large subunit family protein [Bradyrhizobium ottawaense]|uniref:phage terminase large subunit family protein n=1 Tax=Bradyrhizobium ottawaense TaxID=931866 RepID=UPI0038500056